MSLPENDLVQNLLEQCRINEKMIEALNRKLSIMEDIITKQEELLELQESNHRIQTTEAIKVSLNAILR